MEDLRLKFFLAANSCEGFCSYFDKAYSADDGWRAFIIKGGPGTGKSSFMKYFAVKAADKGIKTLLFPCSSDPDSLDAVILPEKKLIVMDGTPPHTVEPVYPAACERILNFSDFWNDDAILENKTKIIEITKRNKAIHKTASNYLAAAGQLLADNYKTALACTDTQKVNSYAEKLCHRYIPKKTGIGKEWFLFAQGITPKGIISFSDSLLKSVNKSVIINDEFASASNIIINKIRNFALENGYEIITFKNSFLPSLICDHIIIPELSICFATENQYMCFSSDERRIHSRRFVSSTKLHLSRMRMKFNKKAAHQLFIASGETLSHAKSVHDELEKYYSGAMDFEALTEFAVKFTEEQLT